MLVDSHAHLNFEAFEADRDKVIEGSLAHNICIINVGSNYETSKRAVEIAENYKKGIFAAIGIHPIHAQEGFDREKFRSLASSDKVVAIGEIGLDYYRDYGNFKGEQKEVFLEQISLAQELNLPIIFHCRKAHQDLIEVISNFQFPISKPRRKASFLRGRQIPNSKSQNPKLRGVVHCFTGDWLEAEEYLKMGFYLGFNGIIYKLDLKEVIKKTPLEKILIETDCPFLTPPQANAERNEPIFVKYIVQDIAKIKDISYQEITKITTKNAKKLFKI